MTRLGLFTRGISGLLAQRISPAALVAVVGCGSRLSICDITDRSCQEDIYYTDLRLRGDGYDPLGGMPPVRVIDQSQYRQEMLDVQADQDHTQSESQKRQEKAWNAAYALLRFIHIDNTIDGTNIENDVATVAAYYAPSTRSVTVIARPDSNKTSDMQVLAHEFLHAMQERDIGLSFGTGTNDQRLAREMLVEGDARFYETLFVNELKNDTGTPLDLTQSNIVSFFQTRINNLYKNYFPSRPPISFASAAAYTLGAAYLASAWSVGGNAAVRRTYATAPSYSVGFLAPERSFGVRDDCPPTAQEYLPIAANVQLGSLHFYAFLRAWSVPHEVALATAQSWSGDRLRIGASADSSSAAVSWRIELDTPAAPDVLAALTSDATLAVTVETTGIVVTGTNSTLPVTWIPPTDCR